MTQRMSPYHIEFQERFSSLREPVERAIMPRQGYKLMTDFNDLPALPLGTSDFATLRLQKKIYVDKTALIYELASLRQKFFLTRPRRFGKSLLVSTFASLFQDGLNLSSRFIVCIQTQGTPPLQLRRLHGYAC